MHMPAWTGPNNSGQGIVLKKKWKSPTRMLRENWRTERNGSPFDVERYLVRAEFAGGARKDPAAISRAATNSPGTS